MRKLIASLLAISCYSPPPAAKDTFILKGDYILLIHFTEMKGSCSFVPEYWWFNPIKFDYDGQMKSPLLGVDCQASYKPFAMTCEGYGSNVTASGEVDEATNHAEGSAEMNGNIEGCKKLEGTFTINPSKE